MERKKKTFKWDACGPSLVFPIDFTSNEVATGKDTCGFRNNEAATDSKRDARGFRTHVLRHPLFRDILRDLAPVAEDDDPMPPIPLEAMPLLDCFYHLAKETKPGYHKSIYCWKEDTPPDPQLMERFLDDLCRELYARIAPPLDDNKPDLYAFCRQVLFQNEHFSSTLFSSIWTQHITQRFDRLKELVKQAPIEQQIQTMADCLVSLDHAILSLQMPPHDDSAQSPKTDQEPVAQQVPVLRQLLNKLLSVRQNCKSQMQGRICYTLPDIQVTQDTSLEDAFWKLGTRKGRAPSGDFRSLMSDTRQAYWNCLSKVIASKQSPNTAILEETYKHLYRYLTLPAQNQEHIVDRIKESCMQYCQQIIAECMCEPSQKHQPMSSSLLSSYEQDLIDTLVCGHMAQATNTISGFIQIVSYYNAGQYAFNDFEIYNHFLYANGLRSNKLPFFPLSQEGMEHNTSYHDAVHFSSYFQDAWDCIYPTSAPLFDETSHRFLDTEATAAKLWRNGMAAARYFHREYLFASIESSTYMLEDYNVIVSYPDHLLPPKMFWESIPPMLSLLLLQLLKQLVETSTPKLADFFYHHLPDQQKQGSPQ